MRKLFQILFYAGMGTLLAGCIVISKNETPSVQLTTPEALACSEIDAAGKLDFDDSRTHALNAIAARTNLAPSVQVHLVNAVFWRLSFNDSKMTVLRTLIKNPSFSNSAKQVLLKSVSKLSFDADRSALLRLINERGDLKA